jgi:hypothetical protein
MTVWSDNYLIDKAAFSWQEKRVPVGSMGRFSEVDGAPYGLIFLLPNALQPFTEGEAGPSPLREAD